MAFLFFVRSDYKPKVPLCPSLPWFYIYASVKTVLFLDALKYYENNIVLYILFYNVISQYFKVIFIHVEILLLFY